MSMGSSYWFEYLSYFFKKFKNSNKLKTDNFYQQFTIEKEYYNQIHILYVTLEYGEDSSQRKFHQTDTLTSTNLIDLKTHVGKNESQSMKGNFES